VLGVVGALPRSTQQIAMKIENVRKLFIRPPVCLRDKNG